MKGHAKWGIAGVVLGAIVALTLPSFAQSPSPEPETGTATRTVTVTGTATIRSAPDEAVVTLGVHTQAATAEEAVRENAEKMVAVLAALQDLGIAEQDVATAWINLWPQYSDSGLTIVGYTAENQLNVTIRDMDKIGRAIDRAVAAGANLTSGIMFQVSEDSAVADEALEGAVADARRKAELLAGAAGATLDDVVTISETGYPVPPPIFYDRAVAAEAGATTPVSPPTLESQVSVTVVWSLT